MQREYKSSEEEREYAKQYYRENIAKLKPQMQTRRKVQRQSDPTCIREKENVRRQQCRDFIQQQKVGRVCIRCGIDDPRVLDFHHKDGGTKEGGLARAAANHWSKEQILREIAKCEIICANCHRILHWEEKNGKDSLL